MNILFLSEEVIEICADGSCHSKNLNQHYMKYSQWGDFICVGYAKNVDCSSLPVLDNNIKCVFTEKENSLKTLLSKRKSNNDTIRNAIDKYSIDFMICHIPSNNSYHAISWAKKLRIPYISIVVGCPWDALWNYDWRGKLLALPAYLKLRSFVSNSPYAIYVTKDFLERRYPCKGKFTNASNVHITDLDDSILKYRIDRINDVNYETINIVTVADVDVRYKGHEYVIKALSRLRNKSSINYQYYLIGGGNPAFLRNVAQKYGIQDCIHFVGPLSHDNVLKQLDSMDICIHPSKQEGLPRALIEAMSRALPAIGTKVAGIPELLSQQSMVRKGSVTDIVNAIIRLSNRDVMLEEAKRNFHVASNYSIDVINERRQSFIHSFVVENKLN